MTKYLTSTLRVPYKHLTSTGNEDDEVPSHGNALTLSTHQVRGTAEVTKGILAGAVPRLQRAEALLCNTDAWLGQRMMRGFCALQLAICLLAQAVHDAWTVCFAAGHLPARTGSA